MEYTLIQVGKGRDDRLATCNGIMHKNKILLRITVWLSMALIIMHPSPYILRNVLDRSLVITDN